LSSKARCGLSTRKPSLSLRRALLTGDEGLATLPAAWR